MAAASLSSSSLCELCSARAISSDSQHSLGKSRTSSVSFSLKSTILSQNATLKQRLSIAKKSSSAKSFAPVRMTLVGEEPAWSEGDYVVVGLAHCFFKDDNGKLQDMFLVEPIPAGALECMDNGGVTCYLHATPSTLGTVLKQDVSLLPEEFSEGKFCDDFEFRALCASRTWKRQHAQEVLLGLIPEGTVRSDWNFSVEDKRILNFVNEVSDSENIKQDMSIDVYGREKKEDADKEIESLYNI